MKCLIGLFLILAIGLAGLERAVAAEKAKSAKGPIVVHNVFFALKNKSPEAKEKLVAACKKYLAKHPGTVHFAVGTREEDLNREVNDRDFDVALHLVFENKAAHDTYQESALHKQFIAENKDNWEKVRVFDSKIAP